VPAQSGRETVGLVLATGYAPANQAAAGKTYAIEARRELQSLFPDMFTGRTKWITGYYRCPGRREKDCEAPHVRAVDAETI